MQASVGTSPRRTQQSPQVLAHAVLAVAVAAVLTVACTRDPSGISAGTRLLWKVPGKGWNAPAVDETTVYFGTQNHELVAVDRVKGTVRWRAATMTQPWPTEGRNIVVAQDVVVMGDMYLHGFDRATGARRWEFAPADLSLPGAFRLSTDGTTVYAGSPEGRIFAVDVRTGAERWSASVPADTATAVYNPAVLGGLVIAGYRTFARPIVGGLVAFDAATGAPRWRLPFEPLVSGQYSGSNGGVFAAGGEVFVAAVHDGRIVGVDPASGAVRWTAPRVHKLPTEDTYGVWNDNRVVNVSPDGGLVVAASSTGIVVALDGRTGAERWRASPRTSSVIFRPGIGDRAVFVNYGLGNLSVLDRMTGRTLWTAGDLDSGDEFFEAPVVAGDQMYITGYHAFYAYDAR